MSARSIERFAAPAGRIALCALFVVALLFAARQFAATIERVGGPAPLSLLTVASSLTEQASRRMDDVCTSTIEMLRTADSLRYCGLTELVDRPGETPAEQVRRYHQAVDYIDASLDRSPFNGITWLYLAAAHLALGDRDAAAQSFDTSYEVAPIAAGIIGMRLGIGFDLLDALEPITLMSLDSEVILLGSRNLQLLYNVARSTGRLAYVASVLTTDLRTYARFMRIVRAPPPGIRR